MKKIKILDSNWIHHLNPPHFHYSCHMQKSKYIEWDRSPINEDDNIVVCTDTKIFDIDTINYDKIKKLAWLWEPKEFHSNTYSWIKQNNYKFNYVLTYDKELLNIGENFIFAPASGCWVYEEDQKIYQKNKMVSIISSYKNQTEGHRLRHEVINGFRNRIDGIFGNGYQYIDYKIMGLQDYRFSISIENVKKDYFFTEKLIDCFMTGTVPIYWGCPSISKFFNINGMLIFNNMEELNNIFDMLSEDLYKNMLPYIEENFKLAKKYILPEDWLIETQIL